MIVIPVVILSLLSGANPAPRNKVVAVLEFQSSKLDAEVLQGLSDQARAGVLAGVKGRPIQIMTRENMVVMQKEMGNCDAKEGECEVETGRNIGADYIVVGSVVVLQKSMTLGLRFMETDGGSLLAAESIMASNMDELLPRVREVTTTMVKEGLAAQGGAAENAGALTFSNSAVNIAVPTVSVRALGGSALAKINIEAEEQLEAANRMQQASSASPHAKAAEWCKLAAITSRNPYLAAAQEACESWTKYAKEFDDLRANANRDIDTLRRFLRLNSRSREEKLAAARSYVETYGTLTDFRPLSEARDMVTQLESDIRRGVAEAEFNTLRGVLVDARKPRAERMEAARGFLGRYGALGSIRVVDETRRMLKALETEQVVEERLPGAEKEWASIKARYAGKKASPEHVAALRSFVEANDELAQTTPLREASEELGQIQAAQAEKEEAKAAARRKYESQVAQAKYEREQWEREQKEKEERAKQEAANKPKTPSKSPFSFLPGLGAGLGTLGTVVLVVGLVGGLIGGGVLLLLILTNTIEISDILTPQIGLTTAGGGGVLLVLAGLGLAALVVGGVVLFIKLKN